MRIGSTVNIIQGLKDSLAIERIGFWLFAGTFSVFLMAMAIAEAKWAYFAILFAPFLAVLVLKRPFLFPFGLYVFLLPFDELLAVTGGSGGATLTKLLGMSTIAVFFLKGIVEKRMRLPDRTTSYWVLLVAYSMASLAWSANFSATLNVLQTVVGLFLLYLVVASYKVKKSEFALLKRIILAGGMIGALFLIYLFLQGSIQDDRIFIVMGGRSTDPNFLAFKLLVPLAIGISMLREEYGQVKRFALWVILIVLVFGIVLTGSRGGMLGGMTIVLAFLRFSKKRLSYILGVGVLALVLIYILPEFVVHRVDIALKTRGSGRLDIWYVGWKSLEKYWLFGAGLGNFPVAYNEFAIFSPDFKGSGLDRVAHNIYISFLVELGLVGFGIMLLGVRGHYKALKLRLVSENGDAVMLRAALLGCLVSSCFIDTFWNKGFWLLWVLIVMFRNANIEKDD